MVGRCISYWNSPFLGDMLVFQGVNKKADPFFVPNAPSDPGVLGGVRVLPPLNFSMPTGKHIFFSEVRRWWMSPVGLKYVDFVASKSVTIRENNTHTIHVWYIYVPFVVWDQCRRIYNSHGSVVGHNYSIESWYIQVFCNKNCKLSKAQLDSCAGPRAFLRSSSMVSSWNSQLILPWNLIKMDSKHPHSWKKQSSSKPSLLGYVSLFQFSSMYNRTNSTNPVC